MNTWKCSMLSAGIVALSTGWAAAAPAVVLDFLNLRVGPGYEFGIIEVIPSGWIVDAGACVEGWCQVRVDGIAGYVDANYLGMAGPPAIATGPTPYYSSYGPYGGRYSYGAYPYRGYAGTRYDPNYAYYDGYDDGWQYTGTFAGAYAQERNAGMRIDRRPTPPARNTAVAKNKATPPGAKVATSPVTTGAATTAIRPNRTDQNPPR
jgi:uncharacterized protein YraI